MDALDYESGEWAQTATPEEELLLRYANCELLQKLQKLTPVQRKRLLCYAEGMTYREIAQLEGTQVKAVQDSIEQARKKLKKFF